MNKKIIGSVVAIAALVFVAVANSEQKEPNTQQPQKVQTSGKTTKELLMRDKLGHIQAILEGVVTEDYEKIIEPAELLGMISQAASWHVVDNEDYHSLSKQFRSTSAKLLDAAKKENHEAVTLQYLQMTISCIECHQYMRTHPSKKGKNHE